MKRILALMVGVLLIFALVACDGEGDGDVSVTAHEYFVEYNGSKVEVGTDASIITSLGSYTSENGEACGTDEKDVIYTLAGLEIQTHVKGGDEYIRLIKILDDSVLTHEGVTIGSTRDEVIDAYGNNFTEGSGGAIRYEGGNSNIEFHFGSSGNVSNIYVRMK